MSDPAYSFYPPSSHYSGMVYPSDPNEIHIPAPAPITTGVPLSERFKGIKQQDEGRPQLAQGGFGYGNPRQSQQNFRFNNFNSGQVSVVAGNKALAAALARKANVLLAKSKLLGSVGGRGGFFNQGIRKAPVHTRVGFNAGSRILRIGSGGVGMRKGLPARGGFSQGNSGNRSGGRIVARGGGGSSRGGRGRGKASESSPLNRGAGTESGGNNQKWFGEPKSKEALDKELELYMSRSKKKLQIDLDKQLDEYMETARKQSLTATELTSSGSHTYVPITAPGEDDIAMTDD